MPDTHPFVRKALGLASYLLLPSLAPCQSDEEAREAVRDVLSVLRPDLDYAQFVVEPGPGGNGTGITASHAGVSLTVSWPERLPILFIDSDAEIEFKPSGEELYFLTPASREAWLRSAAERLLPNARGWEFVERPGADGSGTADLVQCRLAENRGGIRSVGGNTIEAELDQASGKLVSLTLIANRTFRDGPGSMIPLQDAIASARSVVEEQRDRVENRLGRRGDPSFGWPGDAAVRRSAEVVYALPRATEWSSAHVRSLPRLELRKSWLLRGDNWSMVVDGESGLVLSGAVENSPGPTRARSTGEEATAGGDAKLETLNLGNGAILPWIAGGTVVAAGACAWALRRRATARQ